MVAPPGIQDTQSRKNAARRSKSRSDGPRRSDPWRRQCCGASNGWVPSSPLRWRPAILPGCLGCWQHEPASKGESRPATATNPPCPAPFRQPLKDAVPGQRLFQRPVRSCSDSQILSHYLNALFIRLDIPDKECNTPLRSIEKT